MDQPQRQQRNQNISQLYSSGQTMQQIGDQYNLSRERVRQILEKSGQATRSGQESSQLRRQQQEACSEEIMRLYWQSEDVAEVAAELGFQQSSVSRVVKANLPPDTRPDSQKRRKNGPQSKRHSDQEIISYLQAANASLGGVLSISAYQEWAEQQPKNKQGRQLPGPQAAALHFGSWREALLAAGLEANPSSPVNGTGKFGVQQCQQAIQELAAKLKTTPTARQYDQYARLSQGRLPSLATLRSIQGKWLNALEAAGF